MNNQSNDNFLLKIKNIAIKIKVKAKLIKSFYFI